MSRARSVADLGNQNVLDLNANDGTLKVGAGVTIENTGEVQFAGIVTAATVQIGAATTLHSTGLDLGAGTLTCHNITSTGVLTYEDVTSVDSVGIITARSGIDIGTGTSISSPASNELALGTNSEERLRISSTGQVGIGTDFVDVNPYDAKLSVEGVTAITNSDQTILVRDSNNDDAVGRGGNIGFGAYVDGTMRTLAAIGGVKEDAGNRFDGNLVLYTRRNVQADLDERLRISSNGLVTIKNFTGTGLRLEGSGSNFQGMQLKTADSSASQTRGIFIDAANETGAAVANQVARIESDGSSYWSWSTQPSGDRTSRRSERVRITSNGSVGIGLTDPSAKLEVRTSVDGESTLATFKNTNGGGTNETVDIKLGLQHIIASSVILRAGKEANHSSANAADNFFAIHTTLNNTSSEKLRITSGGLVGIGTDNPTAKFQVNNGNVTVRNTPGDSGTGIFSRIISHGYEWTGSAPNSEITQENFGLSITNNDQTTNSTLALAKFSTFRNSSSNNPGVVYVGAVDSGEGSNHSSDFIVAMKSGNSTVTERLRINHVGKVLIGIVTARAGVFNTNLITPHFQMESAGAVDHNRMMSLVSNPGAHSGYTPTFIFGKSRSATAGGFTGVANDDSLGQISFQGADGSELVESARISASVDGVTGTNDMPGRLTFSTTPDNASSPTDRWKISSTGLLSCLNTTETGAGFIKAIGLGGSQKISFGYNANTCFFGNLSDGSGTATVDTGISVNAGNAGGTALVLVSVNSGAATATNSSLYFIKFYYNGNNTPTATLMQGGNLVTWDQSSNNTLTFRFGSNYNWTLSIWMVS